jgi:hypothetical protein
VELHKDTTMEELREFNRALLKMLLKSEEENVILKEKIKHLEVFLISSDIPIIGSEKK